MLHPTGGRVVSARATCRCGWTSVFPTRAAAEYQATRHACQRKDAVRRATRRYRCARCGLVAVYENAGAAEARYWFGRHSCRKREEAMLRSALAQARESMIDRTPKPCLHKVADHQHGTNAAYILDRCRCLPCAAAHSKQEIWRERQKAYGRYNRYVPALPVREHVQSLLDAGMGLKRIVKVSGVSSGALWKLMYGKRLPDGTQKPSNRVLRETAEKLYVIDPAWTGQVDLAPGAKDPDGTPAARQKLQALVAIGWSMSALGRRLGITWERNAITVIRGDRTMQHATVDKANALFEQLCMTPPPETNQRERIAASRSRKYAAEHGWPPPLALDLDDEAVEEQAPDLDEVAIQRRMHGDKSVPLTSTERTELCRRWLAAGRSYRDLTAVCGIQKPERYYRLRDDQEAS